MLVTMLLSMLLFCDCGSCYNQDIQSSRHITAAGYRSTIYSTIYTREIPFDDNIKVYPYHQYQKSIDNFEYTTRQLYSLSFQIPISNRASAQCLEDPPRKQITGTLTKDLQEATISVNGETRYTRTIENKSKWKILSFQQI